MAADDKQKAVKQTVVDQDPQQGGSFVRQKDGTLVANPLDQQDASPAVDAEVKKD